MPANKKETTNALKKSPSSGTKTSGISGNKKGKNTTNQAISKNIKKKSSTSATTAVVKKRVPKSLDAKIKPISVKTVANRNKLRKSVNQRDGGYALSYFILFAIIFVSAIIVIYTFYMFPKKIGGDIKKTLVNVYNPIIFEDSDATILIKLKKRPDNNENYALYEKINNEYGFETKFEKIAAIDEKGINKITFYKNGKKNVNINDVYIYWDEKTIDDEKDSAIKNTNNITNKTDFSNDKKNVQKDEKVKR